jgi:hypothetical protein
MKRYETRYMLLHDMFTICSFNSPDLDGYQGTRENKNVPKQKCAPRDPISTKARYIGLPA